jgi:hypothetical protein
MKDWLTRKPNYGKVTSRGMIGGVVASGLSRAIGHGVGFPILLVICFAVGLCLALLFHIFDRSADQGRPPQNRA